MAKKSHIVKFNIQYVSVIAGWMLVIQLMIVLLRTDTKYKHNCAVHSLPDWDSMSVWMCENEMENISGNRPTNTFEQHKRETESNGNTDDTKFIHTNFGENGSRHSCCVHKHCFSRKFIGHSIVIVRRFKYPKKSPDAKRPWAGDALLYFLVAYYYCISCIV